MSVRQTVFGSQAERRNFGKLSRQWGGQYRVYHNLPFLQVFDATGLLDPVELCPVTLKTLDHQRLKKTSLDYVLCDDRDAPLVAIDFDGLNDGFNVGRDYRAARPPDPWREEITRLKLQVAHGSSFPYFVVASEHFSDFSPDVQLTMVDGIIGEVLSLRAARERFGSCFDPAEVRLTDEQFERLLPDEQDQLIQDWAIDVEVEADFKHNPVYRRVAELAELLGHPAQETRWLVWPPIPDGLPMLERAQRFHKATRYGASCTLKPNDRVPVEREVWLPNFQTPNFSSGLGLVEEMAHLLALAALRRVQTTSDLEPPNAV